MERDMFRAFWKGRGRQEVVRGIVLKGIGVQAGYLCIEGI